MMNPIKLGAAALIAATVSVALADTTMTGDLPRRADLGFATGAADGGLVVRDLNEASAAYAAGLRDGDVIVAVDGQDFDQPYVGAEMLRRTDGGASVSITYRRDGDTAEARFTPPSMPLEDLDGVDTEYGVVETPDGARLRTIVTRPEGANGRLPVIFVTQWVSCNGVEITRDRGFQGALRRIVQDSGAMVIRVERSSGGDSEGPACHELDYDTEVAHYRYAFDRLVRGRGVDPDRVTVWGISLGSTTAPLVAAGNKVAGIVTVGGGGQTYFERMLTFDRIGLERSDADPATINSRIALHAEFHTEYLLRGKTPEAIAAEYPHLAEVWGAIRGTGDGLHYGRPYAWHQQAAKRDFLAAWAAFEGDALVFFAEYDQFEGRAAHESVVNVMNRVRPGSATLVTLDSVGHGLGAYPDANQALGFRDGQDVHGMLTGRMLAWMREKRLLDPPSR